ncbi:MAG: gamma-glutamyl-gamma-aminobutyrate hydrolase family protein [Lachnospiraceae bacterium]|nr:gamma-glutamyl-gamma-aminobutyrate hydrolase family protein [Lachnospiraceae bacterium]
MIIGIAGYPQLIHAYETALQSCLQNGDLSASSGKSPEIRCGLSSQNAKEWDALILPGGGDISPAFLPGQPLLHPACSDVDPQLDRSQLELLDLFIQHKKPILGICKGMQLINLYFGGSLCQHLPTAARHKDQNGDLLHPVYARPGSFLYDLYGPRTVVNSAHHQGILDGSTALGKNIAVVQRSADGTAEGIVHNYLPVIGLQWHPERLTGHTLHPDAADGSLIFQYFLNLVKAADLA